MEKMNLSKQDGSFELQYSRPGQSKKLIRKSRHMSFILKDRRLKSHLWGITFSVPT